MVQRLPIEWFDTLDLPLIAAPMFLVSNVELVAAACENGVIGAIPTVNARDAGNARRLARRALTRRLDAGPCPRHRPAPWALASPSTPPTRG